jgi:hypothetical protein
MNISFHKFYLTPLRAPNARETLAPREGVFLMGQRNDNLSFWEYFPHPELGDESVDDFLKDFAGAKSTPQKKAHLRLSMPLKNKLFTNFLNHELFIKGSTPKASILKYKLADKTDFDFLRLVQAGHVIRLDANGIFTDETWSGFENQIPQKYFSQIEYIEDPLENCDWKVVRLPKARDFISGSPYQVKIYKPYREFYTTSAEQVIFSAPMGHVLGSYLTYLELLEHGDLKLYHGLLTPELYQEVPELFQGNFETGFNLKIKVLDDFLRELANKEWTNLCTI